VLPPIRADWAAQKVGPAKMQGQSDEELRHRSSRNLPESATTNKLRPIAFSKEQTEKPDCRHSRPAEDGARPKRGQHLAGVPPRCRVGAAVNPYSV
jgi:hypothetical protein